MPIRFLAILVCLVLLPAQVLSVESDRLRIEAPASVSEGDPFLVRVSTDRPLSAVEISWLGERAHLPLQESNGTHDGEIILGTEAGQDEPGVRWIGARASGNGSSLVHKRRIKIRNKEFPEEYWDALAADGTVLALAPADRNTAIGLREVERAVEAETGVAPQLSTTGGTSDARFVKDHCPVVEFGLVGQTMHQVDERVELAHVHQLKAIYTRILSDYFA